MNKTNCKGVLLRDLIQNILFVGKSHPTEFYDEVLI